MEDGDTEKYHPSRVIQDFEFLSRKSGCIRCISLQVYNKDSYMVANSCVSYRCHFLFPSYRFKLYLTCTKQFE